jgi:hypothetical protein
MNLKEEMQKKAGILNEGMESFYQDKSSIESQVTKAFSETINTITMLKYRFEPRRIYYGPGPDVNDEYIEKQKKEFEKNAEQKEKLKKYAKMVITEKMKDLNEVISLVFEGEKNTETEEE